jgi:dethiobiotin synthetase
MSNHPRIPGVFITGTEPGAGKTVVAGAIARLAAERGRRVGVFKPVAVGCPWRMREGLACPDAEFLAHCADAPFELATVCPVRYFEAMVPAMAARRAGRPVDLDAIRQALARVTAGSDAVVVEGTGGLAVPVADKLSEADLAAEFGWPIVVVAPASSRAVNAILLSLSLARQSRLRVAAVCLNRYQADGATLAEEIGPDFIGRRQRVSVFSVPEDPHTDPNRGQLGQAVLDALRPFALPGLTAD